MPEDPETTIPGTREDSEPRYRSDGESRSGNYDVCRWNACTWQSRRDDIMVCLGERCRYRFCDLDDSELPAVGSACPWEVRFAGLMSEDFERTFPREPVAKYLDDYDTLLREHVIGHLLANRAAVRFSRASEECMRLHRNLDGTIDYSAYRRFALADRYLAAAHHRALAVYDKLPEASEKARAERMRKTMIAYGHWRPQDGEAEPVAADIPQWIRDSA